MAKDKAIKAAVKNSARTEKLKSVSVQLHPDEISALERLAMQEERSLSYMIRRAVRRMLESNSKVRQP